MPERRNSIFTFAARLVFRPCIVRLIERCQRDARGAAETDRQLADRIEVFEIFTIDQRLHGRRRVLVFFCSLPQDSFDVRLS
ncbi:hypothetical protein MMON44395_19380 [Mycolicibacterium monacense DSM 44395]|nr:hypothetical protein [Mycolicibacterium monacense DSM 44395]